MSAAEGTAVRRGRAGALGACGWLALAATPVFAAMAIFTALSGSGEPMTMGAVGDGVLPLGGMATMYLLMSVFHAGPWLKLMAPYRSAARG